MLVVTTFALESEFAPWRKLRRFRRSDGQSPSYESHLGTVHLRVVLTGIGPHAASAAAPAVFRDQPDLCIVSGLAGGLSETLHTLDVVAPLRVCGPAEASIACDRTALTLALECGARRIDALYSAPAIVITAGQKRQLSAIADAVDMESRTILRESQLRNIPGIVLRAVSDTASVTLPLDLNRAVTPQGTISRSRLFSALLRRPNALPGLVRLAVSGHHAAIALSAFLDAFIGRLAGDSEERVHTAVKRNAGP